MHLVGFSSPFHDICLGPLEIILTKCHEVYRPGDVQEQCALGKSHLFPQMPSHCVLARKEVGCVGRRTYLSVCNGPEQHRRDLPRNVQVCQGGKHGPPRGMWECL